jgi:hypothetical protein
LAFAAVALAATDHWFSGGLPAEEGYAAPSGHSITFIEADANHNNFCIGREQGWGGWYVVGGSHYVDDACSISGGHAQAYYNGACCYHATIENHNTSLNMTVATSTHYDY